MFSHDQQNKRTLKAGKVKFKREHNEYQFGDSTALALLWKCMGTTRA